MKQGLGIGRGFQAPGRGRNRQPGGSGEGIGGNCVCPSCGYTTSHSRLQPCNQTKCPKCGTIMARQ